MMAGGLDGWASQRPEVITNAVCALFLMSRAPPLARERLKEGGKVTQFLANLSKRGNELQKKVANLLWELTTCTVRVTMFVLQAFPFVQGQRLFGCSWDMFSFNKHN